MQLTHEGKAPVIAPGTRIAPNAVLCGDVRVGANCSIGFGAVLSAESGPIVIGENCVVMEAAVIRGVARDPVTIGDNVLIGPQSYLTGCTIATDAFIATRATLFNGARIGRRAEVRINGVVHLRTVLPDDAVVPIGWIAVGDPAKILPPGAQERIWEIQKGLDFPGYVFGVPRPAPGESFMPEVMPRYARALRRWHESDQPTPK